MASIEPDSVGDDLESIRRVIVAPSAYSACSQGDSCAVPLPIYSGVRSLQAHRSSTDYRIDTRLIHAPRAFPEMGLVLRWQEDGH